MWTGVRRRALLFLSSPPLSRMCGWFHPHISVALPIGCDLLARGRLGAPSVRGRDSPNIHTPLLPLGGQGAPRATLQARKRAVAFLGGQPSWGSSLPLGSWVPPQETRAHACMNPPHQVPERKDSLVRAPNQIISYYAHSWPCWEFPSLLNFIWFSSSCKRLQKLLQKLC